MALAAIKQAKVDNKQSADKRVELDDMAVIGLIPKGGQNRQSEEAKRRTVPT
jgi:hypothetical protein